MLRLLSPETASAGAIAPRDTRGDEDVAAPRYHRCSCGTSARPPTSIPPRQLRYASTRASRSTRQISAPTKLIVLGARAVAGIALKATAAVKATVAVAALGRLRTRLALTLTVRVRSRMPRSSRPDTSPAPAVLFGHGRSSSLEWQPIQPAHSPPMTPACPIAKPNGPSKAFPSRA